MTKLPPPLFPTFCHISEYGSDGYRNLHRMLAISQPLNLWAPSSVELARPGCQIRPQDFVRYVKRGFIRVHGRQPWLTDKEYRNNHRFEGARWNHEIDDALLSIYNDDAQKPKEQRRVLATDDETGWKDADTFLSEHHDQIDRWNKIFRRESARNDRSAPTRLPVGVIETARREAAGASTNKEDVALRVARAILRDAFNHGEAFAGSGARVPFLLQQADRKFLELISETKVTEKPTSSTVVPANAMLVDSTFQNLTERLLGILAELDKRRGLRNLDKFIDDEQGHGQLVEWLNSVCELMKKTSAREIDRAVTATLQKELKHSKLETPVSKLLQSKLSATAGVVGIATSAVGLALDPANAIAWTSMGTSVFPAGYGFGKQMGWLPNAYSGPQWPFLYTYGRQANRHRLAELKYLLDQFSPESS